MIAALPMYDWPELKSSTDALWDELANQLRAKGITAPDRLSRSDDDTSFAIAPDLLLGQTCGYPLATRLKGKVQYLRTPEYCVEGCKGSQYSSALLVDKASNLTLKTINGTRFAFNSDTSLSGFRCVRAELGEPAKIFGALLKSGSHRQSARMVASGSADVAALDAVCWHLLQKFEPETSSKLKTIGWTTLRPALPFITSLQTAPETVAILCDVLNNVLTSQPDNEAWKDLAISNTALLNISEYDKLGSL